MAHRPPFKKSLTPIGKGGITKHVGKGGLQQNRSFGGSESLTGGDLLGRMGNSYPKTPAAPMGPAAPSSVTASNDTGPPAGGLSSPAVPSTAPPVASAGGPLSGDDEG